MVQARGHTPLPDGPVCLCGERLCCPAATSVHGRVACVGGLGISGGAPPLPSAVFCGGCFLSGVWRLVSRGWWSLLVVSPLSCVGSLLFFLLCLICCPLPPLPPPLFLGGGGARALVFYALLALRRGSCPLAWATLCSGRPRCRPWCCFPVVQCLRHGPPPGGGWVGCSLPVCACVVGGARAWRIVCAVSIARWRSFTACAVLVRSHPKVAPVPPGSGTGPTRSHPKARPVPPGPTPKWDRSHRVPPQSRTRPTR